MTGGGTVGGGGGCGGGVPKGGFNGGNSFVSIRADANRASAGGQDDN